MGGEEPVSGPILGREGYLEQLTQATFQVQVEDGQVRLLVPDFAYSGFLRPETARVRLYSYQQDLILTLETKGIFSAGILNLSKGLTEAAGTGFPVSELGPDSRIYFKYQNHPEALITLEKVRIGKGVDSEYGFKEVFTNRKELKEYRSAQNSVGEEDFSILLGRVEKDYHDLEESKEKIVPERTGMVQKPAKDKPEFAAIIHNWFQDCLNQNESGKLLTREEEVELAKLKDRADYLKRYAFAAAQTARTVYFPEAAVSSLFAEADAVLEAVISSDSKGLQNIFPQFFSTRRVRKGYLAAAQEIFPQLEEMLTLEEEIQGITTSPLGGSLVSPLSLEFPEEFWAALSSSSAEPGSIPGLRLKSGEAGLQPKLSRYQQLLIQIPFQDKVREQILAGALSTALEYVENNREQKKGGLSPQEKDQFSLILNCSRAYQRGKDLYDQTIDQFLAKNYRLCFDLARRNSVLKGEEQLQLLDYFQEGIMGMKRAAQYFEWERGYKFCTYATWWVRQHITRAITNTGQTIRLPVHVRESINHLLKVTYDLRSQLNREPTPEEIATATGLSEKKVNSLLNMQRDSLSLEHYVSHEDNDADSMLKSFQTTDSERLDGFVHRPISPLNLAIQGELSRIMDSALTQLTPMEELIIRMRNGLNPFKKEYSLEEIGRELGRTRERVRQIEGEGLSDLKAMESLRSCW